MEILGYFASFIMGITLGLLGGGGSILTVPILIYFFDFDAVHATTSSLFIVGLTALIAGGKYAFRNEVAFKSAIIFAIPSFVGIYLARSIVLPMLPEIIFSIGTFTLTKGRLVLMSFAILMIAASYSMLRARNNLAHEVHKSNALRVAAQGVAVGGVTGFVGAGGGFLILPALVHLLGLRMRLAIGTSLIVIAANSILGFSVSLFQGAEVDWKTQSAILIIAVVGSFVGAHYSNRIDENRLRQYFGFFVLIIGIIMAAEQLVRG